MDYSYAYILYIFANVYEGVSCKWNGIIRSKGVIILKSNQRSYANFISNKKYMGGDHIPKPC